MRPAAALTDETLVSRIVLRGRNHPDEVWAQLVDAEGASRAVTMSELVARAMAFAHALGPRTDKRKLIGVCLYHGLDLHAAFVGALLAGHVPTMLAPPSPRMEKAKYADSFRRMLEHLGPDAVVLDSEVHERLRALDVALEQSANIVDPRSIATGARVDPQLGDPDEVAVLQHSSGTTGLQKGVALSHRAILAHNAAYAQRIGLTSRDVIVSWLPLYHDMGFIACFLLPLMERALLVQISPFDWVARPALLLEQITSHAGTLVWLPNFAFSFMAESVRPSQVETLDLGSVRAFINCSEPVSADSMRAFHDRFSGIGVCESQLSASYAMAENVFAVTQSIPGRTRVVHADPHVFMYEHRFVPATEGPGLAFVSNGTPVETTDVAVLDESGAVLAEGYVGELVIRGAHLFSGYYGRDDLTAQAMCTLPGGGQACRTGDLGFLLDGEVYVTGRKKDIIIIQGRNFYPSDVEAVVGRIDGVCSGRVVAFGVRDQTAGTEKLVILAESEIEDCAERKRLVLQIRSTVAQELDCTPGDVRVLPSRWLVKSTSGKLAREDNRKKYFAELALPRI